MGTSGSPQKPIIVDHCGFAGGKGAGKAVAKGGEGKGGDPMGSAYPYPSNLPWLIVQMGIQVVSTLTRMRY